MAGGDSIFSGANPVVFSTANTIPLFIVQALIIIFFCRLLHFFLSRINQPLVISEVIGGVLLGPTAMGHIPGFHANIFPKDSLPFLSLVANLGLILFLFMVGLELDLSAVKRNAHRAIGISVAGMILPFGLGAAVSYALYTVIGTNKDVPFGSFLLFLGVAMAITAFPVLARILTELKLIRTYVGSLTLSAAAIDDVTSWCLLALVVAILNAKSGIIVLWVLLTVAGFVVFLFLVGRPLLHKFFVYTNAFENGPNQQVMVVIFVLVLASAWFTEIIGVHAIFGGFLIGVIIPHDHGLAVAITEKVEDLITTVFLPLYFALSGLKTNVGDLSSALTWGYLILVLVVACLGKVIGCTLAARLTKLNWRESLTVGFLMNCKGLVELIVLNIGYDAGVINTRIFTMMVMMALITTFITTPIVTFLYPLRYQRNIDEIENGTSANKSPSNDDEARPSFETTNARSVAELLSRPLSVLLCLSKMEHMPALMALVQYLNPSTQPGGEIVPGSSTTEKHGKSTDESSKETSIISGVSQEKVEGMVGHSEKELLKEGAEDMNYKSYWKGLRIYALRLIALTQRNSAVMMSTESENTLRLDPLVNMLRTFGLLNNVSVHSALSVCPPEEFPETIAQNSDQTHVSYAIVPWSGSGGIDEDATVSILDYIFSRKTKEFSGTSSQHTQFISDVFLHVPCNVGVYLDRGFNSMNLVNDDVVVQHESMNTIHSQWNANPMYPEVGNACVQVMVPFFGGADDRAAVYMGLRFAANTNIRVSIVRYMRSMEVTANDVQLEEKDFVEASNQMTIMRGQQLASLPRAALAETNGQTDHSGVSPLNHEMSLHPHQDTTLRLQSDQADEMLFHKLFHTAEALERDPKATVFTLEDFPNVSLEMVETSTPLQTAIVRSRNLSSRDLIILGRSKGLGLGHKAELKAMLSGEDSDLNTKQDYQPVSSNGQTDDIGGSAEVPLLARNQNPKYRMLGDAAERFLAANTTTSLIVLQARKQN
ncbi:K(+)/H(+) antiporter [Dispira parvispora]|uniref:K(+)/H(+) antiporter n=1 Tax=Dispira parvispora TaxID=1520584 RepID=A0A9W8AY24_9FUNG|nr:K(+)/H(+) antiporter [Dispira parvispora]